jgi:hypothetical protein
LLVDETIAFFFNLLLSLSGSPRPNAIPATKNINSLQNTEHYFLPTFLILQLFNNLRTSLQFIILITY